MGVIGTPVRSALQAPPDGWEVRASDHLSSEGDGPYTYVVTLRRRKGSNWMGIAELDIRDPDFQDRVLRVVDEAQDLANTLNNVEMMAPYRKPTSV